MKKRNQLHQKKNQQKLKLFSILGGLLLILFILIVYLIFIFPSHLGINIIIISSNLAQKNNSILLLHQDDDQTIVFVLNGQENVDLEEYGKYSLQAVYQLLKLDKHETQKINWLFSKLTGLVIDQVVSLDLSGLDSTALFDQQQLNKVMITNLKQTKDLQQILLLFELWQQLKNSDVSNLDSLTELVEYYPDLQATSLVDYQSCPVVVVNASEQIGVASDLSEILENSGVKVVGVVGKDEKQATTTIYYQDEFCLQTIETLIPIMPVDAVVKKMDDRELLDNFRASIVIVLAKDIF